MANRNKNHRVLSAREEVIADSISAIRKRIIQIQLESEFATKFLAEHSDLGNEETRNSLMESIELMKKEEIAMIAKLNFYKEKRMELYAKKAMKEYDRFPQTITLDNAVLIPNEEEK